MASDHKKTLKKIKLLNVKSLHTLKALEILQRSHDSAQTLLASYYLQRKQRPGKGGISSDAEQDLLRAMLVMASAGLDATAKRLISDALPELTTIFEPVRAEFEKFIARKIVSVQVV